MDGTLTIFEQYGL